MSTVNTDNYGSKNTWRRANTSENYSDSNVPYLANFTGEMTGTMASTSSLDTAISKGIFEINTPIDNSISYIGVDDNCSMVNQNWYNFNDTTGEYEYTSMKKNGNNPLIMVSGSYSTATINSYVCFNPSFNYTAWAYNMTYRSTNPDTKVIPVVTIPMSIVYVIFIKACSKDFDGTTYGTYDTIQVDLYTYINGHTLNNNDSPLYYEDYPNILQIFLMPMYRNNIEFIPDSETGTQVFRRVPTESGNNNITPSIISEIEPFIDSGVSADYISILRYQQPTQAVRRTQSIRCINVYNDTADKRGNNVLLDYFPIVLHGNYELFQQISTYRNYYAGICGNDIKIGVSTNPSNSRYYFYQYTPLSVFGGIENFENYCLSQTAYLGQFFSESYFAAQSVPELDDEYIYLGIIDDSGITHGEYTRGKENRNQKQWDWTDIIEDSPYNPNTPTDPSQYDEETKLYGATKAGTAFLHVYECDGAVIENLKYYLYQIVAPEATDETLTKSFLTVNPIDCITGCYEFPFTIRDRFSIASNIVLGNTHASGGEDHPIVGYSLTQTLRILDFGSVYYYPFYDDFRDYEPYSEALLYIPYVGYIPISPSEFMGHNIGLKMICDLLTGSCQALVYKDGLVIESSSGNIGTQVPITGIQQADYSNSIHSASTRLLASQVSSVASFGNSLASLATGNVVGAVSSIANVAQAGINVSNAKYELEHTKVPFKQSGVASPNVNFSNEQQARLILKRPQMLQSYNPAQYGHTVGFACLITAQLSTFTGFTQATNVDLSGITATVTEKQMIQQQLQSGVYL
ncbi:MAG: hypothetical protein K2I06_08375 [Ruminococcus sp.]|nr:hypothetical protein [Ruminococcus sp.]